MPAMQRLTRKSEKDKAYWREGILKAVWWVIQSSLGGNRVENGDKHLLTVPDLAPAAVAAAFQGQRLQVQHRQHPNCENC